MIAAAHGGKLPVLEYLLSMSADGRNRELDHALLSTAARGGHADVVTYILLHLKVDMNWTNGNSYSSLGFAASQGHADVVKFLLEGAHVDGQTSTGQTALMVAANRENLSQQIQQKRIPLIVLGSPGVGKSTLVRRLAGQTGIQNGDIIIDHRTFSIVECLDRPESADMQLLLYEQKNAIFIVVNRPEIGLS